MKIRYSLYKNGYIKPDLAEVDATRIISCDTLKEAEGALFEHCDYHGAKKSDYHIEKEQHESIGWVTIEGTEIYY